MRNPALKCGIAILKYICNNMGGFSSIARMSVEIEAKFKVDRLDNYARRLEHLGGKREGSVEQKDHFFDRPDRSLLRNDSGLRVRREISGVHHQAILTFKGPCQGGQFKKRTEIELVINDPGGAEAFLMALGYEHFLTVEKKRDSWQLDDCVVCLDEVGGLGDFVEIEGPSEEAIEAVADKLDLAKHEHIRSSYAKMLGEKSEE